MEKKRPPGITAFSVYIILLPLIQLLLIQIIFLLPFFPSASAATGIQRVISSCRAFIPLWRISLILILYLILGVGVFCLNNAARLGIIVLTVGTVLAAPAALIMAIVIAGPMVRTYIINKYGLFPIIVPWFVIALFSSASGLVAFYLTRPGVKKWFK